MNKEFQWFLNQIAPDKAQVALDVFEKIKTVSSKEIPPPICGLTDDDNAVFFSWIKNNKLLSIDIYAVGEVEWFFRDRDTDEVDLQAFLFDVDEPFPRRFISKIQKVFEK